MYIDQRGNDLFLGLAGNEPGDTIWETALTNLSSLLGMGYESAVITLTSLLNNESAPFYCELGNFKFSKDCYVHSDIKKVINAYGNLVLDNKIPEYNLELISTQQMTEIEITIAFVTGVSEEFTHNILSALYYKTKDGITKDIFLYPLTTERNMGYREINEKLKGESGLELAESALSEIWGFGSTFVNIALFAGILIGGVYLINMYNLKGK